MGTNVGKKKNPSFILQFFGFFLEIQYQQGPVSVWPIAYVCKQCMSETCRGQKLEQTDLKGKRLWPEVGPKCYVCVCAKGQLVVVFPTLPPTHTFL